MPSRLEVSALACVFGLAAALTVDARPADLQDARALPVKIVGCVERVPAGVSSASVMFKLMNTQPGQATAAGGDTTSRPPQPPAVLDPEYLLAAAKPIEFAKYQNQRVEVTGVTTPTKAVASNSQAQLPKQTLTVSDLRVIGTECKSATAR